jgi:hypothetical protein
MTRITIDNNGAHFHFVDCEGDVEFTEITQYFWKQLITMARQLLTSPAGGTLTITVPESATSAEADLRLSPIPVAARHDGEPLPAVIEVQPSEDHLGPQNRTLHVEASGNGFSALLSAQETYHSAQGGGL